MPFHKCKEKILLCINSTFLFFNEIYYSKILGTVIGSPILPTVANLVTEELEIAVIAKLAFIPHLYKRYVDACILCIPMNKTKPYTRNAQFIPPPTGNYG